MRALRSENLVGVALGVLAALGIAAMALSLKGCDDGWDYRKLDAAPAALVTPGCELPPPPPDAGPDSCLEPLPGSFTCW